MSYTQLMREIKLFDANGEDDGGVEHPKVECIMLHGCAFDVAKNRCRTLGMCGCALVYDLAHQAGGYMVLKRDNPIAVALIEADMVRERDGPFVETIKGDRRATILTPNLSCGIPRPNSAVDLQAYPRRR
jgi:hypothetical protein